MALRRSSPVRARGSAVSPAQAVVGVAVGPAVRVVGRSELMHEADGPRRGYAHVGLDGYPRSAPGHLECGRLRLFGEGHMLPGEGVDMHTHSDVDNLLIVLRGVCHHEDSQGHVVDLGPGDISLLAAGRALAHSERVAGDEPIDALVVMLEPTTRGGPSQHLTAHRDLAASHDRLCAFAGGGRFASDDVLPLRSESRLLSATLHAGHVVDHVFASGTGYVCVVDGCVRIDGRCLEAGDRALVDGCGTLRIEAQTDTQVVVVEMAAG